jgi:hypothetical protein
MSSCESINFAASPTSSLRARAIRTLSVTFSIFAVGILWCWLLQHGFNAQSQGISYYGVNHHTIVIAVAMYVGAAIGLWWTSLFFEHARFTPVVWLGLRGVAVMLILLLATPYNQGTFYNWAHMVVGVVGALVQLAIAVSLWQRYPSRAATAAFAVQLLGGLLGALSLPDWRFQILLYAEIIFQIGFGWVVLEWSRELPSEHAAY